MVYEPDLKALVCPQCGNQKKSMPETAAESTRQECPNCGAAFEGAEKRLVYQCPYCSSWMSVDINLRSPQAPKKIIPFTFGKKEARERIRDAFDHIPFMPSSFLGDPDGKDIESVFAPFWVYQAKADASYQYKGEKQITSKRGDTVTTLHKVYDIRRQVHAVYNDIMVDAMDSLDDGTIDAALPYNREMEKKLNPIYLAGTSSYLPDRGREDEEYLSRARKRVEKSMEVKEDGLVGSYDKLSQTDFNENVNFTDQGEGVLLPVYRYDYRGFGAHKIYMNGTTGRMSGDAPCDKRKVMIHYLIEAACTVISAAAVIGIVGVLL